MFTLVVIFFFLSSDFCTYDTVKQKILKNTSLKDNYVTHGMSRYCMSPYNNKHVYCFCPIISVSYSDIVVVNAEGPSLKFEEQFHVAGWGAIRYFNNRFVWFIVCIPTWCLAIKTYINNESCWFNIENRFRNTVIRYEDECFNMKELSCLQKIYIYRKKSLKHKHARVILH